MKTVLLVKQVPATDSAQIDETTGTVKRSAVAGIVNPLDLYAAETAILLRRRFGGTITAFSMGPSGAADALREMIAMGVDQGVLISDRSYAGSDTWVTSFILSQAIGAVVPDFDLILCGQRATDGETGQVGPETAAALYIPAITYVSRIAQTDEMPDESESQPESSSELLVTRTVEDGIQRLRVSFPALLTINKTNVSPRLPTLSGKLKAKKAEIKVLTQTELKLPPEQVGLTGSPTGIVRIFRPQWSRGGQMEQVTNDQSLHDAVSSLNAMLNAKGLL